MPTVYGNENALWLSCGTPQRTLSHDMQGEVDRNCAGSLEIEQNRILCRKVLIKVELCAGIDRTDSFNAAFQAGDLVDGYVIRHIRIPASRHR